MNTRGVSILLMMPTMPMMFSPGSHRTLTRVVLSFYHRHHQLYIRNPRQMGISPADDAHRRSSAHHQHHQQNWSIISKFAGHHQQVRIEK